MCDHEHAVFRQREIGFECRDANLERLLERRNGVLRREPAGATMALKIERWCRSSRKSNHDGRGEAAHHVFTTGFSTLPCRWKIRHSPASLR